MSLVSFALRLIVSRALVNKTFAAEQVLNAPEEPLDHVLSEKAKPIPTIAVFSGVGRAKTVGRELTGGERRLDLTIQIFIPARAVIEIGEQEVELEARAAGAAALLNFTWRQISAALVLETGVWPKLFADFVAGIDEISETPVLYEIAKTDKGVRIPAMEYELACRTVNEPMFGKPLAHHWLRLDTAMRAEPELVPLADLIKGLIENPAGMPDWRIAQAALGLSDTAIRASGLAPQDPTETGAAAELSEDEEDLAIDPADLTVTPPTPGQP